jgi:hypothetical protein
MLKAAIAYLSTDVRDSVTAADTREVALRLLQRVARLALDTGAIPSTAGADDGSTSVTAMAAASVFLADDLQLKDCLLKYLQGPCKTDPPQVQMAAWVFFVDSFCIEPSDLALLSSSYHVSRKARFFFAVKYSPTTYVSCANFCSGFRGRSTFDRAAIVLALRRLVLRTTDDVSLLACVFLCLYIAFKPQRNRGVFFSSTRRWMRRYSA